MGANRKNVAAKPREQRQSPPLLRGHKLIRRGKGAPQVFSPHNAACRQSLGSRARTKSPDVMSLQRGADVQGRSNLIRYNLTRK